MRRENPPESPREYEWGRGEDRFRLRVRPDASSLYTPDGSAFHFDAEGRLRHAYLAEGPVEGVHYLRGLDGKVLRKRVATAPDHGRRPESSEPASDPERREVFARAHEGAVRALEAWRAAGTDASSPGGPPPGPEPPAWGAESPAEILARAAACGPERLEAEAARFLECYRPLGVLPPDRYRSLLLQATEGCAYNHCTFCTLYAGQQYRVKTLEEFAEHVARVKSFLGRSLARRRGVFLGEANALGVPQATLLAMLETVRRETPASVVALAEGAAGIERAGGIASFIDVFTHHGKGTAELRALHAAGLRRLFVGIESGDPAVLDLLRKPAAEGEVRELVDSAKRAGIAVGAIVLAGAGGRQLAAGHVRNTAALLRSLSLGPEDMIYLSPLAAAPGSEYDRAARAREIQPLGEEEMRLQEAELRAALAVPRGKGPRVVRYELERFLYY